MWKSGLSQELNLDIDIGNTFPKPSPVDRGHKQEVLGRSNRLHSFDTKRIS
jgi:hypothetical protein